MSWLLPVPPQFNQNVRVEVRVAVTRATDSAEQSAGRSPSGGRGSAMIHAWNVVSAITPLRDRLVDAMVKAAQYKRDFGRGLSTTFDLMADVGTYNREHPESPVTLAEIASASQPRSADERSEFPS